MLFLVVSGMCITIQSCRAEEQETDVTTGVILETVNNTEGETETQPATALEFPDGSIYKSSLPVLYIETTAPVNSKTEYVRGSLRAIMPDGADLYGDVSLGIRLRGNSSLMFEKKPYKLRFDDKLDFFGLGQSRHFCLLACMFDRSLMRDKLGLDLSGALVEFYPRSVFTDVVLNGKFIGTYQLCETIRIERGRVDITDLEKTAEAAGVSLKDITTENGFDITGGYLCEISVQYDEKSKFKTSLGNPVMIKSPEDAVDNKEMMAYLKDEINAFESAIKSADKMSKNREHYSKWFDLDALVSYWVFSQLVKTHDFMINSTFFYKDAGGKIMMGPIWDLGNSLGNYTAANGWTEPTRPGDWSSQSDNNTNWYKYIAADPYFMVRAEERFCDFAPSVAALTKNGGEIDKLAEQLSAASDANQTLYPTFGDDIYGLPGLGTFEEEVEWIKKFLNERVSFMSAELSDIKHMTLRWAPKTSDKIEMMLFSQDGAEMKKGDDTDAIGMCSDYTAPEGSVRLLVRFDNTNTLVDRISVVVNDVFVGEFPLEDCEATAELPEDLFGQEDGRAVIIARAVKRNGGIQEMNFITVSIK